MSRLIDAAKGLCVMERNADSFDKLDDKEKWAELRSALAVAEKATNEPCAGASGAHTKTGVMTLGLHCPGCVSATERIAELEQKAAENEKVFLNANATCGDLRIDLAAMRTLAGGLARQLDNIMNGKLPRTMLALKGENARSRAALAKAKKMGVDNAPRV